ncbi:MAG: hypothetical protein FGM53_03600 [Rhodocyclaceae bacterium]|nr:hypothetical protein [Rhodocyclaceae bacterium]
MNSIYTDTEKALLCDYFNIQRPTALQQLNLYKNDHVTVLLDDQELPEIELASAVGQIALNGHCSDNSFLKKGVTAPRKNGDHEVLIPRLLFTIRWPDSFMDDAWTESYYITFFPGFDRYVVTASQSPNETFDLDEVAIGWRYAGEPRLKIAEDIITQSWQELHGKLSGGAWQSVEKSGLVSMNEACMWRNHVWRFLLN